APPLSGLFLLRHLRAAPASYPPQPYPWSRFRPRSCSGVRCRPGIGELITHCMAQRKPRGGKRPPPPNHILTIALTEQGVAILQALSQGASDDPGRTIAASATI